MKKICVVGANGKMGKFVCEKLSEKFDVKKVDLNDDIFVLKDIDLVIDFASAKSSVKSAEYCFKNHTPLIVGATGQSISEMNFIHKVSTVAPLLVCSNFSFGIYYLKKILNILPNEMLENISIIEKHHKMKKDKPSGTALDLKKILQQKTKENIEILSERGGSEIGTHQIDCYFGDELVSFVHKSFSRNSFVCKINEIVDYMLNLKNPCRVELSEIYK